MSQPRRNVTRRNVTRLVLGHGINEAWQKISNGAIMPGRTIAEMLWTETFPFDHPNFRIQQLVTFRLGWLMSLPVVHEKPGARW